MAPRQAGRLTWRINVRNVARHAEKGREEEGAAEGKRTGEDEEGRRAGKKKGDGDRATRGTDGGRRRTGGAESG